MKIVQGIRGVTPLLGVYIPHFDQISVKVSVLDFSYTPVIAPMGVKFGTVEGTFGPFLNAKFHSHRCNVLLCGAKNLRIGL